MTLPELHLSDWRATRDTLHLYSQIVGKVRLATTSPRNHWWNVPCTSTFAVSRPGARLAGWDTTSFDSKWCPTAQPTSGTPSHRCR